LLNSYELLSRIPAKPVPTIRIGKLTTSTHCWMGCAFCNTAVMLPDVSLAKAPAGFALEQLGDLAKLAPVDWIKCRGGLSHRQPPAYWIQLIHTLSRLTSASIQAFSLVEIWQWHLKTRMAVRDLLFQLKWAGAAAIGPGGSEMAQASVRAQWSPYRMPPATWQRLARLADELAIPLVGAILVAPGLTATDIDYHLDWLMQSSLAWIEVKALRPQGTRLASLGPPHPLWVIEIVRRIKDRCPEKTVYVSGLEPDPDLRELLACAGADGQLVSQWEVTPSTPPP
jgi:hypothetical protein